jgi:hypothetical protein
MKYPSTVVDSAALSMPVSSDAEKTSLGLIYNGENAWRKRMAKCMAKRMVKTHGKNAWRKCNAIFTAMYTNHCKAPHSLYHLGYYWQLKNSSHLLRLVEYLYYYHT